MTTKEDIPEPSIPYEKFTETPLFENDKPPKHRGHKGSYRYCPACGNDVYIEKQVAYHSTIRFNCRECDWSDEWLD